MSRKFRLSVKKLYEELRRSEWEGETLTEFLNRLERDHPDLRETDEQLEKGELIGKDDFPTLGKPGPP
jgi:hypothetical protein